MAEEPGPSTTRYRKLTEAQITSISGAVSGFTATVAKQPVQRLKWIRQVDAGPAAGRQCLGNVVGHRYM